jgi:DNA-binding NarL/FixJ family response regulator
VFSTRDYALLQSISRQKSRGSIQKEQQDAMTVLRANRINPKKRITVLLADDNKLIRKGLKTLLKAESDIEVVGEAANGMQAVEMAKKLRPAVVVMDIVMPKLNGLDATRQIRQCLPATKVLICSAHSDEAYVERAMELGAAGYISKLTSADRLVAAIRTVQKRNTFLSPAIAKSLNKLTTHL